MERSTVDPETGCWLWQKTTTRGYGDAKRGGIHQGAHRHAWEIAFGPIPRGMTVHHRCFQPLCVFPGHLRLKTQPENAAIRDPASTLRRRQPECGAGHQMAGDNLYVKPSGKRVCRACHARRARERYHRVKENT